MDRRTFLQTSGSAAFLGTLGFTPVFASTYDTAEGILRELVQANDAAISRLLDRQQCRPGHRWRGGIIDSNGLHTPRGTSELVVALACASGASDSIHYRSPELAEPLLLAVNYLLAGRSTSGRLTFVLRQTRLFAWSLYAPLASSCGQTRIPRSPRLLPRWAGSLFERVRR